MAGNLGQYAATVSLNIDPFKASARVLNSTIKATNQEIKAMATSFKGSEATLNSMKQNYAAIGRQMDNYKAKMQSYKKTIDDLHKVEKENGELTDQQKTKLANATAGYNKTAAAASKLGVQLTALNKDILIQSNGFMQMSQKSKAMADSLGNAAAKLNSFGNKATIGLTVPIVAGLGKATMSAVNFGSEIEAIGPLLTNGGRITKQYRAELDELSAASKRWSVSYGISTTAINAGLADLVRAGYTAKQSMSMMPAILDASRASGEDFNGVMEVVTSTMTQFGVKAKNTAQVTDAMTYAANATKSGFSDMGEAMQYTGQSAHAAGISLNETVAMIGLLSNAGLQGSSAGTALNMMLQALARNTKGSAAAMKNLGINIDAFHKGTIGIPEVIDQVTKGTEKMTAAQKVAAINAAFGERGGRAILALMNSGSKALVDLTAKTEKSAGATKKVSDMMGNTAKANVDKLKSSLNVLGIEVGEQLVPHLSALVKDLSGAVKWFGSLDKGTQSNIIKMALFAAAIGPVSKGLGRIATVGKGALSVFNSLTGAIGRMDVASKAGATGWQVLTSGMSKAKFNALDFSKTATSTAGTITSTTTKLGGLAGGFTSLGPAAGIAVAGLAAAGVVIGTAVLGWELWGKKAVESAQRTSRWGSDVGATADKALGKFQNFNIKATAALNGWGNSGKANAKKVGKAFKEMNDEIVKNVDNSNKELDRLMQNAGPKLAKSLQEATKQRKQENQKILDSQKATNKQVDVINKSAIANGGKYTAEQLAVLAGAQKKMQVAEIQSLNISNSKKKGIMRAFSGDFKNMTAAQVIEYSNYTNKILDKNVKATKSVTEQLRKSLGSGKAFQKAQLAETKDFLDQNNSLIDVRLKAAVKNGMDRGEALSMIMRDLANKTGLSYKDLMAQYSKSTEHATKNMSLASDAANKAADHWNKIVLDPKTGKVKTNAQEEIQKALKSKDGWKNIKYDLKHANLSTNAKDEVAKALIATGQWDSLKPSEKKLIIHDEATSKFLSAVEKNGQWNNLPINVKQILATDLASPEAAKAIAQYNLWDGLPEKVKRLLGSNEQISQVLTEAGIKLGKYDKTNAAEKYLKGVSKSVIDAARTGGEAVVNYNKKNPKDKKFVGKDNTSGPASSALKAIGNFEAKKSSQKTFTSVFRTIIEKITKHNAMGNSNYEGGPTYVNDANSSIFREAIRLPGGETFIPQGRNVLLDLPKHTQIIPAWKTSKLFKGIPQFANGTIGYNKAANEISKMNMGPSTSSTTTVTAGPVNNNSYSVVVNVNSGQSVDISKIKQGVIDAIKQSNSQTDIANGGGGSY